MSHKTIIVIDDDQDLRESIVEILVDNEYAATGYATAELALEKIKHHEPSLVIVDNMMPGMGGMALIPILKREYPKIKIIMITAFSTVDNAVAAMKIGADDYLAKPFKRDELIVAIKQNLEVLKFQQQQLDPNMDEALTCLSNPIRRMILATLSEKREMRFMDISRQLGISDHTKVNFHLKNLKSNNLLAQDREKIYRLTPQGEKMVECLDLLSQRITK